MNKSLDKFFDTKIGHFCVLIVATMGAVGLSIYMLVSGWIDGSLKEFCENSR